MERSQLHRVGSLVGTSKVEEKHHLETQMLLELCLLKATALLTTNS